MRAKLPRLYAHFKEMDVHPTMYSAQWFMTLFTYNFPFAVVVRIWDSVLAEGWKVIFRVALALLKTNEGGCSVWCREPFPAPVCHCVCVSAVLHGPVAHPELI